MYGPAGYGPNDDVGVGALVGALTGTLVGALIGTLVGALTGALVGALTGALVGGEHPEYTGHSLEHVFQTAKFRLESVLAQYCALAAIQLQVLVVRTPFRRKRTLRLELLMH
jgi:uncharacterized membrane protein